MINLCTNRSANNFFSLFPFNNFVLYILPFRIYIIKISFLTRSPRVITKSNPVHEHPSIFLDRIRPFTHFRRAYLCAQLLPREISNSVIAIIKTKIVFIGRKSMETGKSIGRVGIKGKLQ